VLDDSGDPPDGDRLWVSIGGRLISIVDAGGGRASRRFVDALLDAGATRIESPDEPRPHTRIVIRTTPGSPEARLRAEALEGSADLILGSVRPTFVKYLARLAPVG